MGSMPKTILVIDDEKDICEILQMKFMDYGFEVRIAHDGYEGMWKVIEYRPHCILLDVRMPKQDGLTFLRKLRAYRNEDLAVQESIRKTPVIVLTGAGDNMKSLFELEGISDYFDKPFDFEQLKDRVTVLASQQK